MYFGAFIIFVTHSCYVCRGVIFVRLVVEQLMLAVVLKGVTLILVLVLVD
jgi:hypothetical protein